VVGLEVTMGQGDANAIPHGQSLVNFAEAVTRGSEDQEVARTALREAMGEQAFIESAGIVGIFNGLVRNADFSGIPLDEGTLHGSMDFRDQLGLNEFGGAANTDLASADATLATGRILGPPGT
jgi:hypothetical protein